MLLIQTCIRRKGGHGTEPGTVRQVSLRAVMPVGANGKRESFRPDLNLRKLMRGVLKERVNLLAGKSDGRLARLRELAENADGGERKSRSDRVKQLQTWRRQLKGAVPVVCTLFGLKR